MTKRRYVFKIRIKHFINRILIFKKRKRVRVEIGKSYEVKVTPKGKQSSRGPGTQAGHGNCRVNIVRTEVENGNGTMYTVVIKELSDSLRSMCYQVGGQCHVYEHELVLDPYNKEAIEKEIAELNKEKEKMDSEINNLNSRIEWMETVGVDEFDEDEFKVYRTLSLLEDEGVGKIEKMREIAKLIKQ